MEITEKLEAHLILAHEVDIKTSPQKIWDFLINIEDNYRQWHPKDHILFKWTDGKPFDAGASFYAEQYMLGQRIKYKGKITESIPGQMITMRFSFPLSIITEKIEMATLLNSQSRELAQLRVAKEEVEAKLSEIKRKREMIQINIALSHQIEFIKEDQSSEEMTIKSPYLQKMLIEFFIQDDKARELLIPAILHFVGCPDFLVDQAVKSWKNSQKRGFWF